MLTDEHAMKVWQEACGAYEDNSHDLTLSIRERTIAGDQAAAAIIAADRAELVERVKVLEGVLKFYADTYCEGVGECVGDFCGKLPTDVCGGCVARAALKDTSHE